MRSAERSIEPSEKHVIKHFIFDMGNVLIEFRPDVFIGRLNVSEQDGALLKRAVFDAEEWAYLDDGSLSEEELCSHLKDVLPKHLHDPMIRLVTAWDEPLMEVAGMSQLVGELKGKGYGLYLLSNASRRQHQYWPRISASRYFDGTLISADVRMVKPNPDIYRHLFETFSLRPQECFFIDDLERNIRAAEALGMQGHVFDGDIAALRRAIATAIVSN